MFTHSLNLILYVQVNGMCIYTSMIFTVRHKLLASTERALSTSCYSVSLPNQPWAGLGKKRAGGLLFVISSSIYICICLSSPKRSRCIHLEYVEHYTILTFHMLFPRNITRIMLIYYSKLDKDHIFNVMSANIQCIFKFLEHSCLTFISI